MSLCWVTGAGAQEAGQTWAQVRGSPGYWRLAQRSDGVWWFLGPQGQVEFLNTVTTVQPFQLSRVPQSPIYRSQNYRERFGDSRDLENWARATAQEIQSSGFKGIGAWSHFAFHTVSDLPITQDLNLSSYLHGNGRRVFDPQWEREIRQALIRLFEGVPLAQSRSLVGYYLDNELDWHGELFSPYAYFNGLPRQDPSRLQVIQTLREVSSGDPSFYGWSSWEQLEESVYLDIPRKESRSAFYQAWDRRVYRAYFEGAVRLVRERDPNHLILGVRFKGWAPDAVVEAARGLVDAHSINRYPADAKVDPGFERIHLLSGGLPLIVSEFAFHALDGRSGNRNRVGFDGLVANQKARAEGYRLYVSRLARLPYVVAAEWFQWNDEPPEGRPGDGEDVNFGVRDIFDAPYEELVRAIQETAPRLNPLHGASGQRFSLQDRAEIYRVESATLEPRREILPKNKREQTVLQLRSDTLGWRPEQAPAPSARLAWTEQGLEVEVTLHDPDFRGGSLLDWWNHDSLELFIDVSEEAPQPDSPWSSRSHQFVYVPGLGSGEWSRQPDWQGPQRIPDPEIPSTCVQSLSRIVVKMEIPWRRLTPSGERPKSLRANLTAYDAGSGIHYYLTASKEARTQERPGSWWNFDLR